MRVSELYMEGNTSRSSSFPAETKADYIAGHSFSGGMFDQKDYSLGFMELLGMQDNYLSAADSLFDLPQMSAPLLPTATSIHHVAKEDYRNSSSISSASSEAVVNEEPQTAGEIKQQEEEKEEEEDDEDDDDGDNRPERKKASTKANDEKRRKRSEKKARQPRFAFMTKSEVDHLEDGYRWRKYGQKAVKNSPFPRSYFRCTSASCNVKKRVERCVNDPGIVVTTYEGQHTHLSPLMTPPPPPPASSILMPTTTLFSHYQHQQGFTTSCFFTPSGTPNLSFPNERRFCSPAGGSSIMKDHGLLQDIVPSSMLKQGYID